DPDTQARFAHLTGGSLVSDGDGVEIDLVGSSETRHPADGRLMVNVGGSVYLSGPSNEPVWVPDFYIDIYPVTNAEYARFLAATGHPPPQHWIDGAHPEGRADHPVVFVTWDDATAY